MRPARSVLSDLAFSTTMPQIGSLAISLAGLAVGAGTAAMVRPTPVGVFKGIPIALHIGRRIRLEIVQAARGAEVIHLTGVRRVSRRLAFFHRHAADGIDHRGSSSRCAARGVSLTARSNVFASSTMDVMIFSTSWGTVPRAAWGKELGQDRGAKTADHGLPRP